MERELLRKERKNIHDIQKSSFSEFLVPHLVLCLVGAQALNRTLKAKEKARQ